MFHATGRRRSARGRLQAEVLESRRVLDARVLITEFVADNESGLRDDDRDRSDWIEVRNVGDAEAQLEGWYLTDDQENLSKWAFPATTLRPQDSQIVFASGKHRASAVALHTNFKLSRDGEYLALVRPDGTSIEHQFSPTFPQQFADVAFGLPQEIIETTVAPVDASYRYFVPTEDNGSELANRWQQPDFDDAAWLEGTGGIGYGGSLAELIDTDVRDQMRRISTSLYMRVPFNVDGVGVVQSMALNLRFDDGFVAYVNGHEVVRANVDGDATFDSAATQSRRASETERLESFSFEVTGLLREGENVLGIHGLNRSSANTDMLIRAELVAEAAGPILSETPGFFSRPSPGVANGPAAFAGRVEDAKVSVERGFLEAPQAVEITTATVGASLIYTTDGTVPMPGHGTVVAAEGPDEVPRAVIDVSQSTTLRVMGAKDNFIPSSVDTYTYLLLDDVIRQSPEGDAPTGWPERPVNGQVFDYGMDPDIVDHPEYGPLLKDALLDLPSFSIVTDPIHFFDRETGIYVNGETARGRNAQWERPTSVELLDPSGDGGFQIDAGIRLRGGASRADDNPKHAFRLFFREQYGPAKLRYPLFGDEGVDEFDNIDLRTAQAPSWTWAGEPTQNTLLREVFSRDTQRDMGNPYTRSRYYHLYLNGQYWGIYQTQERAEASFGESYFGGDKDDYDVIKVEPFPHQVQATDGNDKAWRQLWDMAKAGFESNDAYLKAQGLNPDGTRNPEYPVLLDVDNLIDYVIIIFYTGDRDAAITDFGNNAIANNFYAILNRNDDQGFRFFNHDAEWTLMNVSQNRLGPWPAGDTFEQANPQWLHQKLMHNADYRMRFADRVHQHVNGEGALTVEASLDRITARAEQLELAIIAESARWGDHRRRNNPLTREDWEAAVSSIRERYIPARGDIFLSQLRDARLNSRDGPIAPLASTVEPPQLNQLGGQVPSGFKAQLTSSADIYFTTDGSDPRKHDPIIETTEVLSKGASVQFFVPSDDSLGQHWTSLEFDDSEWTAGTTGIGHGKFGDLVSTDTESAVKNINASVYARIPFTLGDKDFDLIDLLIHYDDGVVIYLNGSEVARLNAPETLSWNSVAPKIHRRPVDAFTVDLTEHRHLLRPGQNLLALHGLNRSPTSDFLLLPSIKLGKVIDFGINPQAQLYTDPFVIDTNTVVKARAFDAVWSALTEAVFTTTRNPLRVNELMYHPLDPTAGEHAAGFTDADDFEYVEFINSSATETIDLAGVKVSDAIDFEFPMMKLEPGEVIVIARNEAAFRHRYGDQARLAGEYLSGQLSNGGESVRVTDAVGAMVQDFRYDDQWYPETDGDGRSLVSIAAADELFAWSLATGWRASIPGGTPGFHEAQPGDSNRDGVFDSGDLVQVFSAGEYEDLLDNNSSWEDGDWNGDGDFDSSDLVLAFAEGGYRK